VFLQAGEFETLKFGRRGIWRSRRLSGYVYQDPEIIQELTQSWCCNNCQFDKSSLQYPIGAIATLPADGVFRNYAHPGPGNLNILFITAKTVLPDTVLQKIVNIVKHIL
jgi:hypothetical protein